MYLVNLIVEAGSDWGYSWPLLSEDGESQLDPTSWIATAVVVPDLTYYPVLHWSTEPVAGQGTMVLAVGSVTMLVPKEMSREWTWFAGQYEVRLYDPSNRLDRTIGGRITVDPMPELVPRVVTVPVVPSIQVLP